MDELKVKGVMLWEEAMKGPQRAICKFYLKALDTSSMCRKVTRQLGKEQNLGEK